MFKVEEREAIKTALIKAAQTCPEITGIAITGSASLGKENRWSDIDLAFGVNSQPELNKVLDEFTERMYAEHEVVDHLDVFSGKWIYRVFLLATTLQVDLAFAPASDFGALGPNFKLISGEAATSRMSLPREAKNLVGWGWLYALHARSCIAKGKSWQAEYMVSGMRD